MFVRLVGQLAHQVATFGRGEPRVRGFANDAKPEQGEVFAWISAHAHLRVPLGNEHHPIRSTPPRKGRASVGPQRLAAADHTSASPHGWHVFTEARSSSLPGSAERFECSCFAVSGEHDGGWIQMHRHGYQCRRQGWGTDLKAAPPLACRCHRHPQPIRYVTHPEPTDDAECQSTADHLDFV